VRESGIQASYANDRNVSHTWSLLSSCWAGESSEINCSDPFDPEGQLSVRQLVARALLLAQFKVKRSMGQCELTPLHLDWRGLVCPWLTDLLHPCNNPAR